jgi:phage gp46-like protein
MSFDLKLQNGDLVIDKGDLKTVIDNEKLIQDVLKILITDAGANPSHPWYGSTLSKNIIGSSLSADIIKAFSESQIENSLQTLKKMQELQAKAFQKLSAAEQLASILKVSVQQNPTDLRAFRIDISILTKDLKKTNVSFEITL